MATVEFHITTSRQFIVQADEELLKGERMQACEKAWGAAAHGIKSVAERRGWRHNTHAALFRVVDNIVRLSGDSEIHSLFNDANALHQNFYEGWLGDAHIQRSINGVKRLLEKLDAFMRDYGAGATPPDDDNNGAAPLNDDVNGAGGV